ncbi:MAG: 1-acyl-sn-glycerol-3-phosphate acyltransferase [Gammaproteobacteria bacterium]|nr:1-acyl-sn-glycerol-3-phosphate acyltransferase [Gammaproteobacteria bacterium]
MMVRKLTRGMLKITGWEMVGEAPTVDKAVLIVTPHTSNWDGLWVLAYKVAMGIEARFFAKHTLFWWPLGSILRYMGAIPVNRKKSGDLVQYAIDTFNTHDHFLLGLAPEGTRKWMPYWRTGFYHIAIEVGVPIVLAFIDYREKRIGIGQTFTPSGILEQDLDFIREFYAAFTPRHAKNMSPIEFPPAS